RLPKVTEEILRNILLQYASENCCQSRQFIRDLPIIKIETTLGLACEWLIKTPVVKGWRIHYCLETYLEARYTCWTFEPFEIKKSTVAENGRPPAPWEGRVESQTGPSRMRTRRRCVPHTCRLKTVPSLALKAGCLACQRCKGRRTCAAASAGGQGKRTVLQGTVARRVACSGCDGQGKREVPGCRAHGEIEWPDLPRPAAPAVLREAEVRVAQARRRLHRGERPTCPDELVRDVSGKLIFLEEDEFVSPIQNFPYASVNEASAKLLQEAERSYRGQRSLVEKICTNSLAARRTLSSYSAAWETRRREILPVAVQLQLLHAVPTFEPLVLVDFGPCAKKRVDHSSCWRGPGVRALDPAAFEKHLTIRVGAKDEAGQSASAEHENSGADFRGEEGLLAGYFGAGQQDVSARPPGAVARVIRCALEQAVWCTTWQKSNRASEHGLMPVFLMDSNDRFVHPGTHISSEKFFEQAKPLAIELGVRQAGHLGGALAPRATPGSAPLARRALRTRTKRCGAAVAALLGHLHQVLEAQRRRAQGVPRAGVWRTQCGNRY
uniref:C2H2-type domain-containing protein n=1 Tax=Macrostomum lignano TaxID=282301 RepID=A0A1I8JLP6_9PLAT